MRIKSIYGTIHDTSFGGYPYKVVVMVEIETKEFNKLCPKIGSKKSYFGTSKTVRDLGNLVLDVNNAVYAINSNIKSYNPSIDSNGSKRAVKGVKTLEFVYFDQSHERAEALGFKLRKFQNETVPEYNQYVKIYGESK